MLVMLSKAAVSEFLGYCSIGAWLGAQFPQLIHNAKLQSVEHLALPFLVNWLFGEQIARRTTPRTHRVSTEVPGDITNLIGCILTHQLPFQTYVATYFCFVDICLFLQYIYYSQPRFKRPQPPSYSAVIYTSQPSSPVDTHSVRPRVPARSRAYSDLSDQRTALTTRRSTSAVSYAANDIPRLRQITLTASQIAAAAAAELNSRLTIVPYHGFSDDPEYVTLSPTEDTTDDVGTESEEGDAVGGLMTETLLSNGQHHGNNRNFSWGKDWRSEVEGEFRHRSYSPSQSTTDSPLVPHQGTMRSRVANQPSEDNETQRGRPRTRPIPDWKDSPTSLTPTRTPPSPVPGEVPDSAQTEPPRHDRSASRRGFLRRFAPFLPRIRKKSVGASKRSASIVFLGLFFLGGFFQNRKADGIVPAASPQGTVLSAPILDHAKLFPLSSNWATTSEYHGHGNSEDDHEPEYIIGRVSAWTCTILYLTSRLPQIWKNFARKSVEGLSISLFVCAFLGNFFYVASIMTNPMLDGPAPVARGFLRESVPYLLGSGGTLLFDVTIVTQSFVYAGRPPLPPSTSSGFAGPIRPHSRSSSKMVRYAGDIEYLASNFSTTERDPLLVRTRTRSESMTTHRGSARGGLYGSKGSAIQSGRSMSRNPGIESVRRASVSPSVGQSVSRPATFNKQTRDREAKSSHA